MYLGLVICTQAIYNGCPISEFNRFVAKKIGGDFENLFWFGEFGKYETEVRIITFLLSFFLFYLAWQTWDKKTAKIDLNIFKIFKKHVFIMPGDKNL